MASKSLWAIVDYLRENQTITPRQVQILLGCDCKKSHNLLLHLVRREVVIRTADMHRTVHMHHPGRELSIEQLKSNMSKNIVTPVCRTIDEAGSGVLREGRIMTDESSTNAIIGNTLRIIAVGKYHPGVELTQKMASYIIELEHKLADMAV